MIAVAKHRPSDDDPVSELVEIVQTFMARVLVLESKLYGEEPEECVECGEPTMQSVVFQKYVPAELGEPLEDRCVRHGFSCRHFSVEPV